MSDADNTLPMLPESFGRQLKRWLSKGSDVRPEGELWQRYQEGLDTATVDQLWAWGNGSSNAPLAAIAVTSMPRPSVGENSDESMSGYKARIQEHALVLDPYSATEQCYGTACEGHVHAEK